MLSSTEHQQKPPKHDHELSSLSSFEMHQQKTLRDNNEPNLLLSSTEHQQKTPKNDHEPRLVVIFCRIKDDNKHGSLSIAGQQKNQKTMTKLISVFCNTTTKTKGKNDNKPRFTSSSMKFRKKEDDAKLVIVFFLKRINKTKKRMMMSLNVLSSFVETTRRQQ